MICNDLFLPRDAMRKHSVSHWPVSVHLSLRQSVTLMYCIETAKDIYVLHPYNRTHNPH